MLGHELRNTLGAIGNALHVMALRPGSGTAQRAQEVIARQVVHLARLVDDLLDAARVASGKIALARAPVDLAEVVRHTVTSIFQDDSSTHRLSVDQQPAWVDGDETRLEQVVANLLRNAQRYTPSGGGIDVKVGPDGDDVLLVVRDTGIGMGAELVPRVFNMFVQGSRGLERAQGGLGIGLTLVRGLVELHGGGVEAASPGMDRGSTFTVRLPRSCSPRHAAASKAPQGAGD
jgi:two-component system, sensor histidine kinase